MPKCIKSKIPNFPQYIDAESLYCTDSKIVDCYNHFKERYHERFVSFSIQPLKNDSTLTYKEYWDIWVVNLRGLFLYYDTDSRMIRLIGNYINDEILYKLVYTKHDKLNIFIPLTIVKVTEHKKKLRLYKRSLLMKRKKLFIIYLKI